MACDYYDKKNNLQSVLAKKGEGGKKSKKCCCDCKVVKAIQAQDRLNGIKPLDESRP